MEKTLNRKILFLDFDGVLHPDGYPHFSRLDLFTACLLQMPDIDIVISSTWRYEKSLAELRNLFPAELRARIIGMTPILDIGLDLRGRQREIESFLQTNTSNPVWAALDDMREFFDDGCPNLIWVDPEFGFSEDDGMRLKNWYDQA
ncbi:HAD domain-containing protein [Undibacterium sp. Di26W]|uniref:HAD domain-containing protein n=1 Tax=Undibacterium sp. Di26W TaxID=3413035 RepID=UPI003BF10362